MKPNFLAPIIKTTLIISVFFGAISCKTETKKSTESNNLFFEFSLAQWSLHRTFSEQGVSRYDFANIGASATTVTTS